MKKLKRLIFSILLLALACANICAMSLNASALALGEGIDPDRAYALATDFLTDYYRAVDRYDYCDFSEYITVDALLGYVNSRIDGEVRAAKLLSGKKYGYKLSVKPISDEKLSGCLRVKMSASAEYFYSDEDSEPASYSEDSYLLIASGENGLEIRDWYLPGDPYDEAVRGELAQIADKDFWVRDPRFETVLERQKEWNRKLSDRAGYSAPDYDAAYAVAESFLKEFYPALHTAAGCDLSPYIAPKALLDYTNGRIESARLGERLSPSSRMLEYELETELVDKADLGDCVRLYVAVRASWRYEDADFRSGLGDGVYLLIADSGEGLKIYDWYVPRDPYLEATRGELAAIYNKDFWQSEDRSGEVLETQKKWDLEMVERSEGLKPDSEAAAESEPDADKAFKFAESFLESFYSSAHCVSEDEFNLSDYIKNDRFLEYMQDIYRGEGGAFSPGWVKEHSVSLKLKSFKPVKGCVWLEIVSDLRFKYADSGRTAHSVNTIELLVGFDKDGCVLVDYYEPYWQRGTRPGVNHAYDPDYWESSEDGEDVQELPKSEK